MIQEKTLGKTHPNYAVSLNNIANIFQSMGNYEEALKYFKECLKIQEEVLGKSHPDYAASLNNIGDVLKRMRNYS